MIRAERRNEKIKLWKIFHCLFVSEQSERSVSYYENKILLGMWKANGRNR